ncbi:unnamed protein product [Blepharisma stoltei]|uniref:Uncharacterized protein n=1 Tax=Blepharisma stoltei TaxID=1481888 RepID=A0AAU9KCC8_9CILI|nr:unnamed protein product [Blepharisma stoltei]
MDKIREKSPTEIILERKLLTASKESIDEEIPNTKYNFFKEKAKEIIDFHLNEDNGSRKTLNYIETQGLKRSMFKEEEEPPKLSSSSQRHLKNKNIQINELFQNEISGQSDFLKIKDLMTKQNISLENAIESIKKIKKPLTAIRSSNSKDYTNDQASEIEEIALYLSKEIEKTASSFREVLRLIEQLSKISALEKADIKRAMKEDMEAAKNKAKIKYENQLKAIIEHNKELSSNKRRSISEDDHNEKIAQLQSSLKKLTESYNESIENSKRKNIETNKLQNKIISLNEEIEHLHADIENFQAIIKSQQSVDSSQSANLRAEINYMRDMLNKSKKELEISRKTDTGKLAKLEVMKEREIERLKSEAKILENQLQDALNHMRKGDELARAEIQDLHREVRRLEEENKLNSQRYKEDIENLHRELQEKDKQLHFEREKLITEIDIKEELKRIHLELEEKDKQLYLDRERLMEEIDAKEELRHKQKNEWGEICDNLILEIKTLKEQLNGACEDNRKLIEESARDRQNRIQDETKIKSQKEKLRDKLREQDMELRKFWEVVKELQQINTAKGKIDFNDIRSLMNVKGLARQIKRAQKTF